MLTVRSYYFWKWADNLLAGKPAEVVSAIYGGGMHPALDPFDPAPVSAILETLVQENQERAGGLNVEVCHYVDSRAWFVHVSDRPSDKVWLDDQLLSAGWKAGLTLYEESENRLHGLPKLNVLERPGRRQLVDITAAEIPVLLGEMDPYGDSIAFYDRDGNMFQFRRTGRSYCVEWQILPDRDFSRHRIWIAGRRPADLRRKRLGEYHLFANEILSSAEVKRLWEAFMQSPERPDAFCWREITEELKTHTDGPDRERYHWSDDEDG